MTDRMPIDLWTPPALGRALREGLRPSNGEGELHLGYVAYMEKQGQEAEDCSSCYRFLTLEQAPDYGVCLNRASPRRGLLTWEHQGCRERIGG